ncbi:hypothetical protein [Pontiella sp.]|uniref:hypothetical protein n=1 Tax=Pontiella sp. TaxID=2837462 RepID=UPI0035624431
MNRRSYLIASALAALPAMAAQHPAVTEGSGSKGRWISIASDGYRLAVHERGAPWLLDFNRDPAARQNLISSPDHLDVVRRLAQELASYCKQQPPAPQLMETIDALA